MYKYGSSVKTIKFHIPYIIYKFFVYLVKIEK